MPYPTATESLLGRLAGFASMFSLISLLVRAGNQEWGWMLLMLVPTIVFGWLAFTLLRTN